MPKQLLSAAKLSIGRLLGQATNKERDVMDEWRAMCSAQNVKVTDRITELVAWDLMNGGVNIAEVKAGSKIARAQEIATDAEIMSQVRTIVTNLNTELLQKDEQLRSLKNSYETQMFELDRQIRQLRLEVAELVEKPQTISAPPVFADPVPVPTDIGSWAGSTIDPHEVSTKNVEGRTRPSRKVAAPREKKRRR